MASSMLKQDDPVSADAARRSRAPHDETQFPVPVDSCVPEVPEHLLEVPVRCLTESTRKRLCIYLDPPRDVQTDSGMCKDFWGLGELCGLDPRTIKYIDSKADKTRLVLAHWETNGTATVGCLLQFLLQLDREDVITDCRSQIVSDAEGWISRSRYSQSPTATGGAVTATTVAVSAPCGPASTIANDLSWQLTIHDEETRRKQFYSCCLCYPDEDEDMADLIKDMYGDLGAGIQFFCLSDRKLGTYEYDTVAKVIKERCQGKVVFFLSPHFNSSDVCHFCLQFAKMGDPAAKHGLLVPFLLSEKPDIPNVLQGIAAIRWFREKARKSAWGQLTNFFLSDIDLERADAVRKQVSEKLNSSSHWTNYPPCGAVQAPAGPWGQDGHILPVGVQGSQPSLIPGPRSLPVQEQPPLPVLGPSSLPVPLPSWAPGLDKECAHTAETQGRGDAGRAKEERQEPSKLSHVPFTRSHSSPESVWSKVKTFFRRKHKNEHSDCAGAHNMHTDSETRVSTSAVTSLEESSSAPVAVAMEATEVLEGGTSQCEAPVTSGTLNNAAIGNGDICDPDSLAPTPSQGVCCEGLSDDGPQFASRGDVHETPQATEPELGGRTGGVSQDGPLDQDSDSEGSSLEPGNDRGKHSRSQTANTDSGYQTGLDDCCLEA